MSSVAASYDFVAQPAAGAPSLCIYRAPHVAKGAIFRVPPVATPHLVHARDQIIGAMLLQRWNGLVEAAVVPQPRLPSPVTRPTIATTALAFSERSAQRGRQDRNRNAASPHARRKLLEASPTRPRDAAASQTKPNVSPPHSDVQDQRPVSLSQPVSELGRELAAAALPIIDSSGSASGMRRKSVSPSKSRRLSHFPRAFTGVVVSESGAGQASHLQQAQLVRTSAPPLVFDGSNDATPPGLHAAGGSGVGSASATFNHPSLFGSAPNFSGGGNSDDPSRRGLGGASLPESIELGGRIEGGGPAKAGPFLLTASSSKQPRAQGSGFGTSSAFSANARSVNVGGGLVFASQLGAPSAAQVGLPLWAALEAVKVRALLTCSSFILEYSLAYALQADPERPALSRAAAHATDLFVTDAHLDAETKDPAGMSKWGVGRWMSSRALRREPHRQMHNAKVDARQLPLLNDRDEGADGGIEHNAARQLQRVYLDPSNFVGSSGSASGATVESGGVMSRSTYARWRGQALEIDMRVSHRATP